MPVSAATLADRLNPVFDTVYPKDRGPDTFQEVCDAIAAREGPTITPGALPLLCNGHRENPYREILRAMTRFFGVNVAYIIDDELAGRVERDEPPRIVAVGDAGVRNLVPRAARLTPDQPRLALNLIEAITASPGGTGAPRDRSTPVGRGGTTEGTCTASGAAALS